LNKVIAVALDLVLIIVCAAIGVMLLSSSLDLYSDNEDMGKALALYAWPIGLSLLALPSVLFLSDLTRCIIDPRDCGPLLRLPKRRGSSAAKVRGSTARP
jgi:hypothetical protein